jgi:DNA-binding NtrC family response regulator
MQFTVRLAIDMGERAPRLPTVLVISDDGDWRAVLRRTLEEEGYQVLAARHAGHALVTALRYAGRIDLLVSDGAHGCRRSDFSPRIFAEHPRMRLLHLDARPRTREELLAAVTGAFS